MLRSKVVIMKNGELNILICKNGIWGKDKIINYKSSIISYEDLLSNSRVKLIVEGEEVFIHSLETPRVGNKKLYLIIKNELISKFHDIENIIFDYRIYSNKKNAMKVIIYCLNILNSPLGDKELFKTSIIKSVESIQGKYIDFHVEKVKRYFKTERSFVKGLNYKKFILIASKEEYIYMMKIENGILLSNRVTFYNNNKVSDEVISFIKEVSKGEEHIQRVYSLEINDYEDIKIANIAEIENYLLKSRFFIDNKISSLGDDKLYEGSILSTMVYKKDRIKL
ncbi:MAG: hypothetical protein RR636_00165 [Clostridium sp.]|uniref:hypothetical protein n=1 Tax=Clostridium sp. TaxID=1506 RepID=UPI003020FD04